MGFESKYTKEDLKEMQSWPLERKIRVTQLRIIEWYEHFNGNVYVSFSGGKDSTVLLDLVRRIYPDVPAVYSDTGLEYPELKEFIRSKDNVTIIRPKMVFTDVISKYGYPLIGKEVAEAIYYARQIHPKRRAKAEREDWSRNAGEQISWDSGTQKTGTPRKANKYSRGGGYRRWQLLPSQEENPHGSIGGSVASQGGAGR